LKLKKKKSKMPNNKNKFHPEYSKGISTNIQFKSRRVGWAGHVAQMREKTEGK
jgi:hypothetical protein